jgi:hypothetical protein
VVRDAQAPRCAPVAHRSAEGGKSEAERRRVTHYGSTPWKVAPMDIGKPRRVITVEPEPQPAVAPEPLPEEEPAPVSPNDRQR